MSDDKDNKQPISKELAGVAAASTTTEAYRKFLDLGSQCLGTCKAFCDCDADSSDEDEDDDVKKNTSRSKAVARELSFAKIEYDRRGEFAVLVAQSGITSRDPLFSVDGKPFLMNDNKYIEQFLLSSGAASPSPYGDLKTNTTVHDEKVRRAWEVSPDRIALGAKLSAQLNLLCVNEPRLRGMFGNTHLRADLLKLNIYPEGGHFKPHQDTPRPGAVGTMLIELPFEREGGDLYFVGHQTKKTLTIQQNRNTWTKKRELTAVAFFGEMIHGISEVKKGFRVSLSFLLKPTDWDTQKTKKKKKEGEEEDDNDVALFDSWDFATATKSPKEEAAAAEEEDEKQQKKNPTERQAKRAEEHTEHLKRSIEAIEKIITVGEEEDGFGPGVAAILLEHRYALDELAVLKERPFAKQGDFSILSVLRKVKGIDMIVAPVLVTSSHVGKKSVSHDVKYFSTPLPEHKDFLDKLANQPCVFVSQANAKPVFRAEDKGAELTGNSSRESSDKSVYSLVAVIMMPSTKVGDKNKAVGELDNPSPTKRLK